MLITRRQRIEPFSTHDNNHMLLRMFAREYTPLLLPSFSPSDKWTKISEAVEPWEFHESVYREGNDEQGFEVKKRSEHEPRAGGVAVNEVKLHAYGLPAGMHFEMECSRSWLNPRFIEIRVSGPEGAVLEIIQAFHKRFGEEHRLKGAELKKELLSISVGVKAQQWPVVEQRARYVLKQHPDAIEALFGLGIALTAQGNLIEGQQTLQRLIELQPEHYDALYNLGIIQLKQNKPGKAIELFHQSLTTKPDNHPVLYWLGQALEALDRREAALAAYNDALRTAPEPGTQGMNYTQEARESVARLRG